MSGSTLIDELRNALLSTNPAEQSKWLDISFLVRFFDEKGSPDVVSEFSRVLCDWLWQHFKSFPVISYSTEEMKRCFEQLLAVDVDMPFDCAIRREQSWGVPFWAGLTVSTQFTQLATFDVACQTSNSDTVNTVWADEQKRFNLVRQSLMYKSKPAHYSARQLRGVAKYRHLLPSSFQPCIATMVIDRICVPDLEAYLETQSVSVLDPCAGWGHRFIGFWASERGTNYVGFDPNGALHEPYSSMATFLQSHFPRPKKTCAFVRDCAETDRFVGIALRHNSGRLYDLVLTCPPYFDVESYAKDDAQSDVRFKAYPDWVVGFLRPMIANSFQCLRRNGVLALVAADCNSCPTLCADIIEAAIACGFQHKQTISLQLKIKEEVTSFVGRELLLVFRKVLVVNNNE